MAELKIQNQRIKNNKVNKLVIIKNSINISAKF